MKRQRNTFERRKGQQNIFRTVSAGRENILLDLVTGALFSISSYPSYIVEIFLRNKFGERYFTTVHACLISFFMVWVWFGSNNQTRDLLGFTWLIFTALFLWKSIKHRLEIKKYGTAYDFERFSYSDGEILPFWWNVVDTKVFGITVSRYRILTIFEPAIPVITGLILSIIPFTRGIGFLIFLSGLLFGFRSFMKAHAARAYVLDIIDEQICMAGKHDVLVKEKPKSQTKGLSLPIELPKSIELREELSNSIKSSTPLDIWDDEIVDENLESA